MKAVAKSTPAFGVDVIDVEPPALQRDEVLVRVAAAGICGSDVHIYEWISEVLPLSEAARGFELLRHKDAFKVLLRPED